MTFETDLSIGPYGKHQKAGCGKRNTYSVNILLNGFYDWWQ